MSDYSIAAVGIMAQMLLSELQLLLNSACAIAPAAALLRTACSAALRICDVLLLSMQLADASS
jgi:hypothetical protein